MMSRQKLKIVSCQPRGQQVYNSQKQTSISVAKDAAAASALSRVGSSILNFTLNRKYTFKSAANVPIAMLKVAAYYAVFTPLSTWLEHLLTTGAGWNEYLVTAINMLLNFVTEFLYQRFFVFGKSLDTNVAPSESEGD